MFRLFPPATLTLMLGPVICGLLGTLAPAFGYLPVLGGNSLSLQPWQELLAAPGLGTAVFLSLRTGFLATLLAVLVVILFCAAWHGRPLFQRLQRLISPLLSVPHVTVAFGLAFLLLPSGWLLRLFSPWATGFQRPPDWLTVQDPMGWSLVLGLVIKEVPFLLLMTLAALGQADAARSRDAARLLGYGRVAAWLQVVLPRIYPQLRLPIFAVLAFSVSVVDVALILGPSTPPTLAVMLVRWFNDPDLAWRFVAAAGALLQLALVLSGIALWWALERLLARLGLIWSLAGQRWLADAWLRWAMAAVFVVTLMLNALSLLGMSVWAFAGRWRFPAVLPQQWSLESWTERFEDLLQPFWTSVSVALGSALVSLLLAAGCLEHEARYGRRASNRGLWLLYVPLVVPQIAFLFGTQVLLVMAGLDGTWLALAWSHLVFVLPYVYLALADPYRAWDQRYARSAACLGAPPARVLWRIKLPMLLRPLLVAWAVGFAVSIAQYLPTLFAGAGRLTTLTTEAVGLAAGGDRRLVGVYALLQMLLPLLAFTLALMIPGLAFRNRRGLQVAR